MHFQCSFQHILHNFEIVHNMLSIIQFCAQPLCSHCQCRNIVLCRDDAIHAHALLALGNSNKKCHHPSFFLWPMFFIAKIAHPSLKRLASADRLIECLFTIFLKALSIISRGTHSVFGRKSKKKNKKKTKKNRINEEKVKQSYQE